MKTLKLILAMMFFGMLVVACGDDDPDDGNVDCNNSFSINAELADETLALSNAAQVYGNDPTPANCNAYKAAFQDYLDAAGALEDCANQVGQGAEYQAALQQAQDGLDALQC